MLGDCPDAAARLRSAPCDSSSRSDRAPNGATLARRAVFEGSAVDLKRRLHPSLRRRTRCARRRRAISPGRRDWCWWPSPRTASPACRWEASRGGDLFPHVYGTIPARACGLGKAAAAGEWRCTVFPPGWRMSLAGLAFPLCAAAAARARCRDGAWPDHPCTDGACRRARRGPPIRAWPSRPSASHFPIRWDLRRASTRMPRCPTPMLALGFGFIEIGTVTPRPQAGNPRPRLFRLPGGPRRHQPHGLQQRRPCRSAAPA